MRTVSLALVIVAVTLQAVAAKTAKYRLNQQSGGHESNLSDDGVSLVDPEWGSGPGCASGTGALKLSRDDTVGPNIDNTDRSLTFSNTMSFFIHVYHEQTGLVMEYFDKPRQTQGGVFMVMETNSFYVSTQPSVKVDTLGSTVILPTFKWHHIGFTYDSGIMRLYANGKFIVQQTVGAINTNFNTINLGRSFEGKIACAYFSSDVLDVDSVEQLMEECQCPPEVCEDCYCYKEDCYQVGFDYCHNNQCSSCDANHCCCCERDMEKCTDKPCTCIDPHNICSDLNMEYCEAHKCQGQCDASQCCCTKEVKCPVWSECHCMTQECSELANLHDCDRCCTDCPFGHCCCCDTDWPVCPDYHECHCEDRPCDQIPGSGYCDPSKCKFSNNNDSGTAVYKNWLNYVCPSDQCCCNTVVAPPPVPAP